jgi:hypothetical protein
MLGGGVTGGNSVAIRSDVENVTEREKWATEWSENGGRDVWIINI